MESAIAELDTLWAGEDYRSQVPWTREELHDRADRLDGRVAASDENG